MAIDGDPPEDIAPYVRGTRARFDRRARENSALPGLREFFVDHDAITQNDVENLNAALDGARDEADIQRHLQSNPHVLVQRLRGGHGRWVIPQRRLGSQYVPDFLLAERSSLGVEWTLVELESPHRKLFNNNGDPAQYLNHAIRQITDWRTWLAANRDYATRTTDLDGLGLVEIDRDAPAWIIIGRRHNLGPDTRLRRRELGRQNNIHIHTYDWLVEAAESRVDDLARTRQHQQDEV
jgi:hypothetical protein